jgi:hypothetical protein
MAEILFQWAFHWLHGTFNQQFLRLYIKQDIIEDNMEIRGRRRGPSAPASASPPMAPVSVTVRHKEIILKSSPNRLLTRPRASASFSLICGRFAMYKRSRAQNPTSNLRRSCVDTRQH